MAVPQRLRNGPIPVYAGKGHSHRRISIKLRAQHWRWSRHCVCAATLTEATENGTRKQYVEDATTVALLIIDDIGMRKLAPNAAEDILEIIMRRYEQVSTILTSNRPVEDWGQLLGDNAAVTAMLDRLLHHGHVIKCGPRSWRTKTGADSAEVLATNEASR